jgi:hypothetical protein
MADHALRFNGPLRGMECVFAAIMVGLTSAGPRKVWPVGWDSVFSP